MLYYDDPPCNDVPSFNDSPTNKRSMEPSTHPYLPYYHERSGINCLQICQRKQFNVQLNIDTGKK